MCVFIFNFCFYLFIFRKLFIQILVLLNVPRTHLQSKWLAFSFISSVFKITIETWKTSAVHTYKLNCCVRLKNFLIMTTKICWNKAAFSERIIYYVRNYSSVPHLLTEIWVSKCSPISKIFADRFSLTGIWLEHVIPMVEIKLVWTRLRKENKFVGIFV